jgi:hypothetical protein
MAGRYFLAPERSRAFLQDGMAFQDTGAMLDWSVGGRLTAALKSLGPKIFKSYEDGLEPSGAKPILSSIS